MPASAALVCRSFRVGARVCTITLGHPDPLTKISPSCAEWSPDVPLSRLPADEQAQFEAGRLAALEELAQALGGNVTLITADPVE